MKHRWIAGLLLVAASTLAACAPPEEGAGEESPTPTPGAATDAPEGEEAPPTDSDGGIVDY